MVNNTDQNSMCVSIVFKAAPKEKYDEKFVLKVFVLKLKNILFRGPNNIFFFFKNKKHHI